MKILIAEDDPASLLLLKSQLRRMGHEVTAARNGQEAWAAMESVHFPLLVSDCMMPELDGFELCRRVRAQKAGPYTYIMLLTAHEGREHHRQGLDAGADDFLTKPFDPEQFRARLRVGERILALEREVVSLSERLKASSTP